jgi:hypothetical protein
VLLLMLLPTVAPPLPLLVPFLGGVGTDCFNPSIDGAVVPALA